MSSVSKMETIYGLLWLAPVDTSTLNGLAVSLARKQALSQIDKEGQKRGIKAAQALIMHELPEEPK